ncbi:TOMM precursor leader peptide-binding protein [Microbacterium sp. LMI1-1-1.1]|uniref:TOMM precursor leader peptide-binding protein n=1 Tax=Microbacterium sp. LMI1-1-1.1 TaxID=3135223 RepID=UPI0034663FE7
MTTPGLLPPREPAESEATTYRVRTGLYVLPHGDDEVFVREGSRAAFSKIVRDPARRRLLARIVQAATDPVSASELADRWGAACSDIEEIAAQLADAGVLTRSAEPVGTTVVALHGEGLLADALTGLLRRDARLDLRALDQLDDVLELFASEGVESGDVVLAIVSDVLNPVQFLEANTFSLEFGIPAIYVHTDGPEAVIGPLVVPGETACYLCHDLQDEGARHLRDEYLVYKDSLSRGVPGPGSDPAVIDLAAAWARMALARRDPSSTGFLDQRVLRVETSRMEVMSHRILTIPRCPACATTRPELQHTFL